jgi:hypothetical protein
MDRADSAVRAPGLLGNPPFHCPGRQNPEKMFYNNQHIVVSHAHSLQGKFDEGFTRIHLD